MLGTRSTTPRSPRVVFSHGKKDTRFRSFFFNENFAGHGLVVVAPGHAGNTALDLIFPRPPTVDPERPLDEWTRGRHTC